MNKKSEIGGQSASYANRYRPSLPARTWAKVVGRLARISEEETRVSRRGFTVERVEVVERLETIGKNFVWGYNRAVQSCDLSVLEHELAGRPTADAGFSFEGAAMGLAVGDWMTPGRRMFDAYIQGPAKSHKYLAWVGLGWALARLPVSPMRVLASYSNVEKWLALDGYGFHEGYFHWKQFIVEQRRSHRLTGDAARVFDQGLGRSLWFVRGANPKAVSVSIDAFDIARQEDLWAGVGLAAAYAGGIDVHGFQTLCMYAGRHQAALLQGVVFAAQARLHANNIVDHTDIACSVLFRKSTLIVASIAIDSFPAKDCSIQSYQDWRRVIQVSLSSIE